MRDHAPGAQQEDLEVPAGPPQDLIRPRASRPAERIVSLVPSITENLILFGKRPAGRTSFCVHPRDRVRGIPVVGGTKTPKIDRIAALRPDLVIANREENRKEDVEELRRRGLEVRVTYPTKVADVVPHMEELSALCKGGQPARRIVAECRGVLEWFEKRQGPARPRVAALIWKDPWMGVGAGTYSGDLIETAGGTNALRELPGRYPTLREKEIADLEPDLLLLPTEPYRFGERDVKEWASRLAGSACRVALFPGEDLSWFGPRVARALAGLSALINSAG